MAEIVRAAAPSLMTNTPPDSCRQGKGLIVGEDVKMFDPCYVHTDGKVYRSNGSVLNSAAAKVRGYAASDALAAQNDAVTLWNDIDAKIADGTLAVGTDIYLSATTPGRFSTTPTTGGTKPCGWCVTSSIARLHRQSNA
jgi:hypothetical protein